MSSFLKSEEKGLLDAVAVGLVNGVAVEKLWYQRSGMDPEMIAYSAGSEFISSNVNDFIITSLLRGNVMLTREQMQPLVSGLVYSAFQYGRPTKGAGKDGFLMNMLAQTGSSMATGTFISPVLNSAVVLS